jgi:hypothetical protein
MRFSLLRSKSIVKDLILMRHENGQKGLKSNRCVSILNHLKDHMHFSPLSLSHTKSIQDSR